MIEIILLIILLLNYIIPYTGVVKLSKKEKAILDSYQHTKITLNSEVTELISDNNTDNNTETAENFSTMNVLGDLDNEDYTDIDLKDIIP